MYILIAIAVVDAILLAATIRSARRRPLRPHHGIARGDAKIPHAL